MTQRRTPLHECLVLRQSHKDREGFTCSLSSAVRHRPSILRTFVSFVIFVVYLGSQEFLPCHGKNMSLLP